MYYIIFLAILCFFDKISVMKRGIFITFEGCEGSGKSTQSRLLGEYLKKKGFKVVLTREPGGTALSENIRQVLLHTKQNVSPIAELMLFEAGRAQHVKEVILPSLKAGKIIICDRYTDATLAYQGFARGLDLRTIKQLNDIATGGVYPHLTIYIDIPAKKGLNKAKKLSKASYDRLENEKISFHEKVRKGYLAVAKSDPKRVKIIKCQKNIEGTHNLVIKTVNKIL
jgi:dTMP kinase